MDQSKPLRCASRKPTPTSATSYCITSSVSSTTHSWTKRATTSSDASTSTSSESSRRQSPSDGRVFFTPKSLVRMIMNVIEPERGTMLDPACGSGGMFVSAADYVARNGSNPIDFHDVLRAGRRSSTTRTSVCMNMAVWRAKYGDIKSGDAANSFYHDAAARGPGATTSPPTLPSTSTR